MMTPLKVGQSSRSYRVLLFTTLLLFGGFQTTFAFAPPTITKPPTLRALSSSSSSGQDPPPLNVAIVGVGPSGLLLAHLLLKEEKNIKVHLFERRSDPRNEQTEQRAYALGLGVRGRTAIRKVDETLWEAVKKVGFESERFQLHIGNFVIPLRSEKDSNKKDDDNKEALEPSLLLFRTALCAALTDELEQRHGSSSSNNLKLSFDQMINTCDLKSMKISTSGGTGTTFGPYDLIVGTDGVNSVVRQAIQSSWSEFETEINRLPGEFKVVQLNETPPKVDPLSVSLILPKSGSATAFVEPTGADGSCCVLFAGKADSPILSSTTNSTFLKESLLSAFPQWEGPTIDVATEQLMAQKITGSASSITCNTYHYGSKAVLVGDAAHATGGVSGQGVNSALIDSAVLADCISRNRDSLQKALMEYSKKQLPEGKALYDLSFAPKPSGLKGIQALLINARDTLFRGRWGIGQPPLQTRLTTSLTSFSEIRREKQSFYPDPFPEDCEFHERLEKLHGKTPELIKQ